ncbi:MAG TPA: hypothetical protein VF844_05515 [Ktedonobacteraceae bacterium]
MVRVETAAPTAGVDVAVLSEQKSMPQPTTTQQECKSYRPGMFRSSYRKYELDLKRHTEQGWRLVSCTEAGRDIFLRIWLTATYKR